MAVPFPFVSTVTVRSSANVLPAAVASTTDTVCVPFSVADSAAALKATVALSASVIVTTLDVFVSSVATPLLTASVNVTVSSPSTSASAVGSNAID